MLLAAAAAAAVSQSQSMPIRFGREHTMFPLYRVQKEEDEHEIKQTRKQESNIGGGGGGNNDNKLESNEHVEKLTKRVCTNGLIIRDIFMS